MAMKTRRSYGRWSLGLAVALGATALSGGAEAAPTERYSKNLRGSAVSFGITMGWDCGGTLASGAADCLAEVATGGDTSPDIYWNDALGVAGPLVLPGTARTTVGVTLPAGAVVDRAFLYWSARAAAADPAVTLEKVGGATSAITAEAADVVTTGSFFQAVADVTDEVIAGGPGAWRLTGLDAAAAALTDEDVLYSAWSLVIVYEDANPAAPVTRVRIYDGLDLVDANATLPVTLTGGTPDVATPTGTVTVLAYDGDFETTGDSLSWNGTPLTDAQNPADNFFNSSRSRLGVGFVGADFPELPGTPDTVSSLDLDVVDVSAQLTAGEGDTTVEIAAGNDSILLGALITTAVGCGADTDCTAPEVCDEASGSCATSCTTNADCAEPTPVCDTDGGVCVECLGNEDCEDGETCNTTTHVCEGGGAGGAGGAGSGGGSASGGAGVGGAGTGATSSGSGQQTTGTSGNDFSGLAAEGGGCSLSAGSAKQTALLFGVFAAAAGLLARRRRRS
jgi:hypothetical protein